MNTIVCNTLSGAVSEYTRHDFDSVTATHCAGVDGLFAFGGDNDAGLPITTELRLPATLRENTLKQQIAMVYLSMRGQGEARFTVFGPGQSWSYPFPLRDSDQARCPVGKGKATADHGIATHNAALERFKALLDGYRAYAMAYETVIKAEMNKVEVYKAMLQAEQTKADINQSLVARYKAEIDGRMAAVEIYKTRA